MAASGGGSGEPVTFSAGSAACSVSGTTVTFKQAGSCVIDANQAGNAQYQPAPQAQQMVAVTAALIAQAIRFTSSPPSPAVVGGTYTVAASGGGSGEPVTFSTGSAACSVSGNNIVTFTGPGSCVIDANQAGNAQYQPVPQAQQTVTVTSASPAP